MLLQIKIEELLLTHSESQIAKLVEEAPLQLRIIIIIIF